MPGEVLDTNKVSDQFIDSAQQNLQETRGKLEDFEGKRKGDLAGESSKDAGWNSDTSSVETEKYVNDVFIKEARNTIRGMEDAIGVLENRQSIVAENGEVSQRKFGDIVWGYKTTFPDVDGTIIEEEVNVMLVPSALVRCGDFKSEINGQEVEIAVVSPISDVGKKIIEASL